LRLQPLVDVQPAVRLVEHVTCSATWQAAASPGAAHCAETAPRAAISACSSTAGATRARPGSSWLTAAPTPGIIITSLRQTRYVPVGFVHVEGLARLQQAGWASTRPHGGLPEGVDAMRVDRDGVRGG
jgi:hypothetical protein